MPIKFDKETSALLFRYVRSVDIKFNGMLIRTPILFWMALDWIACLTLYTCSLFICLTFILAFDARAKSVKELLRQLRADRFYKVNPNLKIHLDIHNRIESPFASFNFVDGTTVRFMDMFICCERTRFE